MLFRSPRSYFSLGKIRANFTLFLLHTHNYLESTHHVTSIKICTNGAGGSTRTPGSSTAQVKGKSSSNERLSPGVTRILLHPAVFIFPFPGAGRGRRSSPLFYRGESGGEVGAGQRRGGVEKAASGRAWSLTPPPWVGSSRDGGRGIDAAAEGVGAAPENARAGCLSRRSRAVLRIPHLILIPD